MFNKEAYRQLCQTEKTIPLFSRDWWLDAACGEGMWDLIWIEQGGQVRATCPLFIPHKGIISMPPFTQTMGPWLAPVSEDTKYTSRLSQRQELCKQIIAEIGNHPHFLQNFSYEITDWLPFYWQGFSQTTRYTYILPDLNDKERLWENMSLQTRRHITKARDKQAIRVVKGVDAEELLAVYTKTFQRQGKRSAPHQEILRRLIDTCRERNQGDIWAGYDEKGNLHAAVFIAWQESSAYYIAGGGDPAYRDSGAHSLVMWEAIQAMSEKSEKFDFEGSMLPGVERFFREFGAEQTPYFTISKGKLSLLHRAWLKLKSFV
ncbi:GNAT family N-acetyltransferase [Parabacteroides sp. OttesenSCG-928-O15]|nr:GNAT family N-acetyltransferase [Parabacteroides sp. OttesenSCG-928-O15]